MRFFLKNKEGKKIMLIYKVQYKTNIQKARIALVKLADKCGNCLKLESRGFKGLCVNNCTFNPYQVVKSILERETEEIVEILETEEIPQLRYPDQYGPQWAILL